MKYQYETASDLAVDEDFIQWVKAPTHENDLYWESWLQRNPYHRELVEDARQIVLLLSEDDDELHEFELNSMWRHLNQRISTKATLNAGGAKFVRFGSWQKNPALAVAASFGILLLLSALFLYNLLQVEMVEHRTAYGEKKTVQLPDESVVVLNGNSKISYAGNWSGSDNRLVQLDGEAFFEVTHQENDQKFVVQTQNGVQVEVLGTAFDVSSRGSRNRIVLASGKVRLAYEQGDAEKHLIMEPGELVEMEGSKAGITRKNVKPELYTSWKDNKVIFDNTSLREIATMLEEVYGYHVTMKEDDLADMKITAQLDDRGLENILSTLSETLGVTITKENQEIKISHTNQ